MLHDEQLAINTDDKEFVLSCLTNLVSGTLNIPRRHELNGIKFVEEDPATSGNFSDIHRIEHNGKTLCIKATRLLGWADVTEPVRVSVCFCSRIADDDDPSGDQAVLVQLTIQTHLSHPNVLPLYGAFHIKPRSGQIGLVFPWRMEIFVNTCSKRRIVARARAYA